MKRTHLILGMMLLFVAAALAVYTTDGPGESGLASAQTGEDGLPRGAASSTSRRHWSASKSPRASSGPRSPVIETLRVEPTLEHPAIEAQADRVETGARNRLEELVNGLQLTDQQQCEIFPLLARSHPDYNGSLRLIGIPSSSRIDPLGKRAAESDISKLLDPDQQLELEIMSLEADAWWTDIIAALEMDLKESTKLPLSTDPAPERDPTPPNEDPPPPAATPPAPSSRPNNLFDLLQSDRS